ncbi:MAG: hypothetical protein GTO02_11760 [Candidatus Dadabacteria bacterium]|nr:hypothetical protein [Candidatus Dadabacteria bacterium]NIQ15029.1 hypothetical protein [Candidatus Dadabacteria bacterium]
MFNVIYSNLIIVVLMGIVLVPNIHAQENSEVNGSEEVSDKVETTESNQELNEQNQQETQVPREISDRAPDSIPQEILQSETIKRSIFTFDPFSRIVQPWRKLNSKLRETIRLELTLAYTALYQVADKATQAEGKNHAAGGIWDFSGLWEVFSENKSYPAYIGFRSSTKHKLFTDISPSELGENIGSLWRTDGTYGENNFFISQLWWEQHIFDNKLSFRVGKIDQSDYIDSFNFSSAKLFFINSAFSSNPTISYPGNGLGAAVLYNPDKFFYILSSFGDANGDSSTFDFGTFFNEQEFFAGIEVGFLTEINRHGNGNYHVAIWHSDRIKKQNVPSGRGLAITFQQQFRNEYNTFLRYSYTNGDVTDVKQLLSGGVGVYDPLHLGINDNLLGLAFAWGEPEVNSLRSQYVIESFLRLQVFPSIQVTPDIQLIINPSEAPDENIVAVLGMRFRIAF